MTTARKTLRQAAVDRINARLTGSPVSIIAVRGDWYVQCVAPDTGRPEIYFERLLTKEQAEAGAAEWLRWHADHAGKTRRHFWIVEDVGRTRFRGEGGLTFALSAAGPVTAVREDFRRFTEAEARATASRMNPGNGAVCFEATRLTEWA